jgi:tetratricopeptide (TPR) repeat protein
MAKARIQLKQGNTHQQRHDYEQALAAYDRVAQLITEQGDARFLFALQFNRSVVHCYLGHLAEAEALYLEAAVLADRLRLDVDQIKKRWLDGHLAAGHGRMREALAALEEVRQKLIERGLDYDAALVTLEMAVLLAERGQTSEVRALAQRTAPIFQRQGVDREALACFVLFQRAAVREAVTAELARGLIERLKADARRR